MSKAKTISLLEQALAEAEAIVEAGDIPPTPPTDPEFVIEPGMLEFDASSVPAGETIWLRAGERERIRIKNINGTGSRISIRPLGGKVEIISNEKGKPAIVIKDSNDWNLIGGTLREIKIAGTNSAFGLRTIGACTRYSLQGLEVTGVTNFVPLMLNAGADCTRPEWGYSWTIEDVLLDNVWSHGNDKEVYIGSSFALPIKDITCQGADVPRVDPLIVGLIVRNSVFEGSRQDGLQIMGALDIDVHNNKILNYGRDNRRGHKEGLRLGKWVSGEAHDNTIKHGLGHGIFVHHRRGGLQIFNNAISYAGFLDGDTPAQQAYGIRIYTPPVSRWEYLVDKSADADITVENNTVAHSTEKPFSFVSEAGEDNRIVGNTVIEDVPEMDEDDMLTRRGDAPLTFEGNVHRQTDNREEP